MIDYYQINRNIPQKSWKVQNFVETLGTALFMWYNFEHFIRLDFLYEYPILFFMCYNLSVQALKQIKEADFTENTIHDVERIKQKFQSCQKVFAAFGDETRQYIISALLCGKCNGSRVLDIAGRTNLSRPAVSHHMQILKNAGIVKTRKEGTYVYYYLDPEDSEIKKIIDLFSDIQKFMKNVPDRSGDDD